MAQCSVVSDSTVRSGEFSKAMLRRMACDGVKSESVDDGAERVSCGIRVLKIMICNSLNNKCVWVCWVMESMYGMRAVIKVISISLNYMCVYVCVW